MYKTLILCKQHKPTKSSVVTEGLHSSDSTLSVEFLLTAAAAVMFI